MIPPTASPPLRVLMMPDYRVDNPYQTLLVNALEQTGVTVDFPWGYRRVLPIWRMVRDSLRDGKAERHAFTQPFDVLHLHWLTPYLKGSIFFVKLVYALKFLLDVWLVRRSGVRVVWTVHNLIPHDSPFPRLERWVGRRLVQLADQIIVHHASALGGVRQAYGIAPDRAQVIPLGHYRGVYQQAIAPQLARAALALPPTGLIYLHQGMLRPYKGIERLLSVWSQFQPQYPDALLVIAGRALDQAYSRRLAQLATNTPGVVLHDGYVEDSRMHLYFSAADVMVLPFEAILTSSSVILAMSYDLPVIAPRLGGIAETVGAANALLYDPQEQAGLLTALKTSTEADLAALRLLVKQECDRLDWNDIAQQTRQVYTDEGLA